MTDARAQLDDLVGTLRADLVADGWRGDGSIVYRQVGEVLQCLEFQPATRNSATSASLFLNGAARVGEIDTLLGRPVAVDPPEALFHVRFRPNQIDTSVRSRIDFWEQTDLAEEVDRTRGDLQVLRDALDTLDTAQAVVDELATHLLAGYEETFGWYLAHGQELAVRRFVRGLHGAFGEQDRWVIFARNLDAVADSVGTGQNWQDWL